MARFWRFDRWRALEKFRLLESYGEHWQIEHYFLPAELLPEWLKNEPPLDPTKLDCRFSEKPKSKKIPEILMPVGKLYLKTSVYTSHFASMLDDAVETLPIKIGADDYLFVRPRHVIDCVDTERSDWLERDDGFRYAWRVLALKGVPDNAPHVFLPGPGPEFWTEPVFSDAFVERCRMGKVVGSLFEQLLL